MPRRFPSPFIGVPDSAARYWIIVSIIAESDQATLPWEVLVERSSERYRDPETGDRYSETYMKRVLRTFDTLGVVDRHEGSVSLSPPAEDWYRDDVRFEEFLWRSIKRSWILLNDFPIGIEGLREVHDSVVALNKTNGGGGCSRTHIREYLAEERDYEFNDNGVRGYPQLLTDLSALREEDDLYRPGKHSDRYKRRLADTDIFREFEKRLRREGASVEPPEPRVKRDLAKYYMYRESGGLGKERRWYETFWKDYVDEEARRGESSEAELQKSERYRDVKNERKSTFKEVLAKYDSLESSDIQGLSADVLRRMRDAESFEGAQQIKMAAGSGVSRLDIDHLNDDERSSYRLPESFELYDWQQEAVHQWFDTNDDGTDGHRGIAQVVTGAGKTVMALEIIRRWLDRNPNGVVTVVVPTRVLMHQWLTELASKLNVPSGDLGWAGGGHKDSFSDGRRILVSIVNSAVKDDYLGAELREAGSPPHLLVADECHRYTGEVFSNIFEYPRTDSLGLSATPLSQTVHSPSTRDDLAEADEVTITDDDELLLRELGPIYYTLTYDEGLERGLIPRFSINYVGFDLAPSERETYDALSRQVSNALKDIRQRHGFRLETMGGDFHQNLQALLKRDDVHTPSIADYFEYTTERRELVSNAIRRQSITHSLLENALEDDQKAIVFQERINQLETLVAPLERRQNRRSDLYERHPGLKEADKRLEDLFSRAEYKPVMYHSGHTREAWNDFAMEWFREEGFANVMLSVKALIEGVDVPSADIGVVRVSSSSVRQRIQTLGRILRTGDDLSKHSQLYVLYAQDTVDTAIFDKHDWGSELANAEINHFVWETAGDSVDGTIRSAEPDEIPSRREWTGPDIPDPSDLERGDPYSGPKEGHRVSVDSEGNPFQRRKNSRRYITTEEIKSAASYVLDLKGGGTIIINEAGHLLTHLPDGETVFLGVLEGGFSAIEYGEDTGRLSGDAPTDIDDIF